MDQKYKPGDQVLPKLNIPRRSREQRRLDETERRLVEEVQERSRSEAVAQSLQPASRRSDDESRSRSRDHSHESRETRARDHRTRSRREAVEEVNRHRAEQTAMLQPGSRSSEDRSRHRSGSRQPSTESERHVEHQSSIISLISASDPNSSNIELEIQEFARQIQEEGLLDGLDLDNLDLSNNDELSRRITEAYRRRHRDRPRHERGRRSDASGASRNSEAGPTEPRPQGRETASGSRSHTHSHPRSHSATRRPEAGTRPPPANSLHLEVQEEPRRNRRRTVSEGRSATIPIAPAQSLVSAGARSQTDLAIRPSVPSPTAAASSPSRPRVLDSKGSAPPSMSGSPQQDASANTLPFSARASAMKSIPRVAPISSKAKGIALSVLPTSRLVCVPTSRRRRLKRVRDRRSCHRRATRGRDHTSTTSLPSPARAVQGSISNTTSTIIVVSARRASGTSV